MLLLLLVGEGRETQKMADMKWRCESIIRWTESHHRPCPKNLKVKPYQSGDSWTTFVPYLISATWLLTNNKSLF